MPWKSNPVMIFYNKKIFAEGRHRPREPAAGHLRRVPGHGARRSCRSRGRANTPSIPRRAASSSSPGSTSTRCSRPRPAASSWSRTARPRSTRPDRLRGRQLLEADLRRQSGRQGDLHRRLVRRRQGRHGHRRPVGDRRLQGQGRLGRRAGPDRQRQPRRQIHTFSDAKNVGMYASCTNHGTAWDFLKFTTCEEQDGQLLTLTGQMPLRQNLPSSVPRLLRREPAVQDVRRPGRRARVEVPERPELGGDLADLPGRLDQLGHLRQVRVPSRRCTTPRPRSTISAK